MTIPVDASRRLFAVASLVAVGVLLVLGQGMTFFSDEWAFIQSRSLADPMSLLVPHNEHWTTLPAIAYRLLVETVGIGSYVPYQGVVVLAHVVVAVLTFTLLERTVGSIVAVVGGAIVLFLGAGFENLYWAFQTTFVGSTLFGLAALVVTQGVATPRRAWAVATLLLASLACSGVGVIMCVAVGLEWLMDRRWRRLVPVLAAPALIFLAWYLAFGRSGVETQRDPFTFEALLDVPAFVVEGFSNAATAITGLPAPLGLALVLGIVVAVAIRDPRRLATPRFLAIVIAIAAEYALAGLVRAHLFEGIANYTRYTYMSAILLLVALGAYVGPISQPAPGPRRLVFVAALASWATIALAFNLALLVGGRELFLDRADMTRALVTVALDPARPADAQLERSLVLVPSATELERIKAAYGDPRGDALVPGAVRPIPDDVLIEARRRLVEGAPIPGPAG